MVTAIVSVVAVVVLVGIDQVVKLWAAGALQNGPIDLIPDVLSFTYHQNFGAAFGILQQKRVFLVAMTLVVIAVGFYLIFAKKLQDPYLIVSVTLIIAGGVGNLVDRIFRGYVIDYIYFEPINFPIFNFADCCVCIGTLLVVWYVMIIEPKREAKQRLFR